VGVVVDKVALGQVFLQVLRFSPVSIIPPLLRTHVHIGVHLFLQEQMGEAWEPSKSNAVSEIGNVE
jgi:branched-subunit amino acid transport protein